MPWYKVTWYSPSIRVTHYVQAGSEDEAVELSAEELYDKFGIYPEDLGLEATEAVRSRKPEGIEEEEEEEGMI